VVSVLERLEWVERVARDTVLPPACCRLAAVLATTYVNKVSGKAWPSQATLCKDLDIGEDTLRRAVTAMVDRGHLLVTPGGGRGRATTYQIAGKTPAELRGIGCGKGSKNAGVSNAENPRNSAAETPARMRPQQYRGTPPNPPRAPRNEFEMSKALVEKRQRNPFKPGTPPDWLSDGDPHAAAADAGGAESAAAQTGTRSRQRTAR